MHTHGNAFYSICTHTQNYQICHSSVHVCALEREKSILIYCCTKCKGFSEGRMTF